MNDIWGNFYSPMHMWSTGKPYMFSLGVRSCGKSTGWLILALKLFVEKKQQFIYIRRTKDELDATAAHAFDNAIQIYNDYYKDKRPPIRNFEMKGNEYFLNGKTAGYAIPLSLQHKFKSLPFSHVFLMLYDEFLVSEAGGRYLGTKDNPYAEAEAIMSLFISVDRGIGKAFRNECRVIFIGNNERYSSPVFMRMGIDKYLTKESKFVNPKREKWAVEQTFEVKALDEAKMSNAYALSSEYSKQYAFEGGLTENTFIGRTDKAVRPMFNCIYRNTKFGVGAELGGERRLIVRSKAYKDVPEYALTMDDHRPNYALVTEWRSNDGLQLMRTCINSGKVLYDTLKARFCFETFFAYI